MSTPTQDWHSLHDDSPLLAEIRTALCAAGINEPAGSIDKTVTLHCGYEKAAHAPLAAQIVSLFKRS